jgi:hypothetical protein
MCLPLLQILKAFTPALTLLLCVLAGLERPRWPLLLSVLLIAGGTAGAVLIESGTPSFHMGWVGVHGHVALPPTPSYMHSGQLCQLSCTFVSYSKQKRYLHCGHLPRSSLYLGPSATRLTCLPGYGFLGG